MICVNGRIVLLSLVSSFLVLALVTAALGQIRTVGVNVGNKFRYRVTASWSSTDPAAVPPSYVVDYNDTLWLEFSVMAISRTNITGQNTKHYKNGAESTVGGWMDVDTGDNSNMTYLVISANLSAGDMLYNSSSPTLFINETMPRTYLSNVSRDTNHISTATYGTSNISTSMYWDKLTGVLVEQLVENTYQTDDYTTSWSIKNQIISSDLWDVPEFSAWALLMLIVLTSAITIVSGQRARRFLKRLSSTNLPSQSMTRKCFLPRVQQAGSLERRFRQYTCTYSDDSKIHQAHISTNPSAVSRRELKQHHRPAERVGKNESILGL